MASSTPLKDLADKFFKCCVCLDQYKVPKQIPCLHRYCSDCLETVIQASDDGTIKCPMCKQQCVIPTSGVAGFKTDFHMMSVLEFIQLQKSFENKELKQCVSCLKKSKVLAYCFKCRDFLCDQCYKVHVSNKMFTDHQPHTLKLNNIEAQNITLEKLASLTEDPRCHSHIKEHAKLCCSTCDNEPICMICTYSKHKGHDLYDVTELAKSERELLKPKLAELYEHKSKIYTLPKKIESVMQTLNTNVAKKKEMLKNQHIKQANKIQYQLAERTAEREGGTADIEKRRQNEKSQIKPKHEEEMMMKYDENIKRADIKYDKEYEDFIKTCDDSDGELYSKLGNLENNFKDLTIATQILTKKNKDELQEILDTCEQIIKRYENLTATTSSILGSKDEWRDVQCIPDIRTASETLIKEMKKEFPELESMSDFNISDIATVVVADVMITEYEKYAVYVEGVKDKGWWITGITSTRDGNIVITGMVSKDISHITVINRKGEILFQHQKKRENKCIFYSHRCCCYISEFKVATVCMADELGIYDVSDGSYQKKQISDTTMNWSADQYVTCVAIDSINKHIIVGTDSRYVYIFDDEMNYSYTISLPYVINGAWNIAVHRGNLLVCDYSGKRAYAVTMDESESKMMFELSKPVIGPWNWQPTSVCTDTNGCIYMLWVTMSSRQRYLVQYSHDGRQLLRTKPVDEDARCVTTLKTNEEEKLLIATESTGNLYTFGLLS